MFPLCCQLIIALLLAGGNCQQAEVGEGESGKTSSSLAEFVDNLIDQMNDVKESREREAKKTVAEVEEVEKVVEEELAAWKVIHKDFNLISTILLWRTHIDTIFKVPHEDGDGFCLLLSAEVCL